MGDPCEDKVLELRGENGRRGFMFPLECGH